MTTNLDKLARQSAGLQPAADLLRTLLSALRSIEVPLPSGVPDPAAARLRLEAAIPALTGEPLIQGRHIIINMQIITAGLSHIGDARTTAASVATVFQGMDNQEADSLAEAALAGSWDGAIDFAARKDLDDHAVIAMLDYAARPALRAGLKAIEAILSDVPWHRGTCPGCGAPPLLAELRGTQPTGTEALGIGERVLRCGRCTAAWTFPRLRCPACGEQDHARLSYLAGDGEEEFKRADTCETCKNYLKSIAVLEPLSADELLEEDLATAALDWIALERGYLRTR
ncbi:MAG: formate dehydrogenase accessory protein FdhE [Gemmatimonadaceae bacterium]